MRSKAIAVCRSCGDGTLLGDIITVNEHKALGHTVEPILLPLTCGRRDPLTGVPCEEPCGHVGLHFARGIGPWGYEVSK